MLKWIQEIFRRPAQPKRRRSRPTVKPCLEELTPRIVPSASAATPLPVVSVASPPAVPAVATVTSHMASTLDQWTHLIATVQNDLSSVRQEIAQEAAYVQQQWDQLLGNIPGVQQPGSGSGSGSGTMTTAHNAQDQQLQTARQQAGSGAGSGAMTTAHEKAITKGVMPLASSSSGCGCGSGIVNGEVWQDSDGDGIFDNGEAGFQGITVDLDDPTGTVLMTTTTDANGNYSFTVDPSLGSQFKIQVVIPNGDGATIKDAGSYPQIYSNIYSDGYSDEFSLPAGGVFNVPGGLETGEMVRLPSFTVTSLTDNAPNTGGVGFGDSGDLRYCITQALLPQNAGIPILFQVTGTIKLNAALPDLTQTVKLLGNGSNSITIQGQGNAGNPYRIFTVIQNVNAEIDALTVTGGYDNTLVGGGGVQNDGNLALIDDDINDNTAVARQGGGISNGGKLYLYSDVVEFNNAPQGGGIENGGELIVNGGKIIANNATNGDGGGIHNVGTTGVVQLQNGVQISGNTATGDGGGVYNSADSSFIMKGGFLGNNDVSNANKGGGLYNAGQATLSLLTVGPNNQANQGGGLYLSSSSLTLFQSLTVQNNILIGNAPQGKGIYVQYGGQFNGEGLNDADDPDGQPVYGD